MGEYYLAHHGIKGQRWGVRRYQNADGSVTDAGARRYYDTDSDYEPSRGMSEKTKSNLKTAAKVAVGVAATAGLAYAAYKNPEKAKQIYSNGKEKAIKAGKKIGKKSVDIAKKSIGKTATAATDASLTAMGAVAITKIDQMLPENTGDATRDSINRFAKQSAKESVRMTITEAKKESRQTINKATGSSGSYSSYSSKGNNAGSKTSSELGKPSGKSIDKSSESYRNLMTSVSPEIKSTLKAMANQGYDMDQLERYASLHHSAIQHGYLVHHGIGGMKWGKKNGPPYPLKASAHSSSEKKEGTDGWTVEAKKESNIKNVKKAVVATTVTTAAAATTFAVTKNPEKAKEIATTVVAKIANQSTKAVKRLANAAAVAAVDTALLKLGTEAYKKISSKIDEGDNKYADVEKEVTKRTIDNAVNDYRNLARNDIYNNPNKKKN